MNNAGFSSARLPAASPRLRSAPRQVAHQLEPLAFPAGQRVDRLPQPQITQPDFLQESQAGRRPRRVARLAKAVQELDGFIHRRFQQIGDVPTAAARPAPP